MANGDITAIKKLFRVALPGGGHTNTGVAKNNKVLVVGEITATYVSTGISLVNEGGVKALGAETADFLKFSLNTTDGASIADDALYLIQLDHADGLIYMLEDVGAANAAAPTDGDAVTLRYLLVGDAHVADLT